MKYYLLDVEHGNSATANLGYHYEHKQDFINMKKYYLMAIKTDNNPVATQYLAEHESAHKQERTN